MDADDDGLRSPMQHRQIRVVHDHAGLQQGLDGQHQRETGRERAGLRRPAAGKSAIRDAQLSARPLPLLQYAPQGRSDALSTLRTQPGHESEQMAQRRHQPPRPAEEDRRVPLPQGTLGRGMHHLQYPAQARSDRGDPTETLLRHVGKRQQQLQSKGDTDAHQVQHPLSWQQVDASPSGRRLSRSTGIRDRRASAPRGARTFPRRPDHADAHGTMPNLPGPYRRSHRDTLQGRHQEGRATARASRTG